MSNSILIVEDDTDLLEIYRFILRKYNVILCKNAQEAIEYLKKESPKLALIDLVLPDVDGLELAKILKAAHPDSKIIAVSGFVENFRTSLEKIGIKKLIKKPFRKSEILDAVNECLKNAS